VFPNGLAGLDRQKLAGWWGRLRARLSASRAVGRAAGGAAPVKPEVAP
jgi:hypothetical protein